MLKASLLPGPADAALWPFQGDFVKGHNTDHVGHFFLCVFTECDQLISCQERESLFYIEVFAK